MFLISFSFVFGSNTQDRAEGKNQKVEGLWMEGFCECMTGQNRESLLEVEAETWREDQET